jgi:hypothetical protein
MSPTISPAEFTRRMPEGEGAGPGAPETIEPTTGRPGAGGHGPPGGPGGPPMAAMRGSVPEDPRARSRSGARDARTDPRGIVGLLAFVAEWALLRPLALVRGRR